MHVGTGTDESGIFLPSVTSRQYYPISHRNLDACNIFLSVFLYVPHLLLRRRCLCKLLLLLYSISSVNVLQHSCLYVPMAALQHRVKPEQKTAFSKDECCRCKTILDGEIFRLNVG